MQTPDVETNSRQLESNNSQIEALKQKMASSTNSVVLQNKVVPEAWWTTESAMTISAVVLVFGALVLAMASFLILKGRKAESVLRVFGTIMIIISAVFLVVAGYSSNQIAPVMGLLGTIAGYLLGKESSDTPGKNIHRDTERESAEKGTQT
ncbi:hypothetical protein H8K55_07825 [Undibacterium sp. LX15W]|uniref:Uncharacterized protein n=2 Tax=Undibacterium flavidum TaxID=2762297 RepID=A0ABR6YA36_9BURK|nr:hypothetical protein [Undibacterium flavidum]